MAVGNLEQSMSRFLGLCRERGIKVTHQRTQVLRELARTEEHPDAETLYRRVRVRIPAISLDTVYRTLRLFEAHGIIGRVGSTRERTRFDANTDRHHHYVCTKCGLVHDFYSAALDAIAPPATLAAVGSVTSVYVELRGLCARCRAGRRRARR